MLYSEGAGVLGGIVKRLLSLFRRDEVGSNAIEYGLVLAFVAVALIFGMSKLSTPLMNIIKGWGPQAQTSKPVAPTKPSFGFQNLTPIEVKNLYDKYEGQDKMAGIGVTEWSNVYETVTGTLPNKTDVLKTFDATDGTIAAGGNNDGILNYSEFKAATLHNSY